MLLSRVISDKFQSNSLAKRKLVLKNLGQCCDLQSNKDAMNTLMMFNEEAQALQEMQFLMFYSVGLKSYSVCQ